MSTFLKIRRAIFQAAIVVGVLIAVLLSFATHVCAQRVHLVTVHDSESGISASCKKDVFSVTNILQEWNNISVKPLKTKTRADGLLRTIEALSVGENDVLFFYYAGHGICDAQKQHFLTMNYTPTQYDTLSRNRLREALLAKNARLTILVTDCCANIGSVEGAVGGATPDLDKNLRQLFSASGLVDINSSSPGESAWGSDAKGGLFTDAFYTAFYHCSDWNAFFAYVKEQTAANYKEFKNEQYRLMHAYTANDPRHRAARQNWNDGLEAQKTQTPWKFSLPGGANANVISQIDSSSGREYGVRIVEIKANTAAGNLRDAHGNPGRLNLNDIIYSINGSVLRNDEQDYTDAIDAIGRKGQITLEVIDVRTGQKKRLYGNLDYGNRARFGVGIRTD